MALAALATLGCYEAPGVDAESEVISLTVTTATGDSPKTCGGKGTSMLADGAGFVNLTASISGRTADDVVVTFTTTEGVLDFTTDDAAAARTVSRSSPRLEGDVRKSISADMRVGRTPGCVFVTAEIGSFVARGEVDLAPAAPSLIVAESDANALRANGVDRASVSVSLFADEGDVSLGTRLATLVCCGEEDCENPPLRAPEVLELESGTSLTIDVVSESLSADELSSLGDAQVTLVVAALPSPSAGSTLDCANRGEVAASVPFAILADDG